MAIEVVLGVTAGVIALVSRVLTPQRRWRRKLRRATRRTIADVEEDRVARVVGTVRPLEAPLVAPLSQRPCVCFEIVARRRDNHAGAIVARGVHAMPFVIEDATGRALVTATDANLALPVTHTDPLQLLTPERIAQLHLVVHPVATLDGQLDLEESIIAVGDTVAVLGAGTREPDPDAMAEADYRSAPTRLCMTSSRRYPLVISTEHDTTT